MAKAKLALLGLFLAMTFLATSLQATAVTYPKYCSGKYTSSTGTEIIVTVGCPNAEDTCTCGADGVSCGGRTATVGNMTLVSGSCAEHWTATVDSSS